MEDAFSKFLGRLHPKKPSKQQHSASSTSLSEPSVTSSVKVLDRPNSIHLLPQSQAITSKPSNYTSDLNPNAVPSAANRLNFPPIIKGAKKYQPFKRLPVDSAEKGDELSVLNYSYMMGESTSLQEAVSITCNLVDLAQVRINWLSSRTVIAERQGLLEHYIRYRGPP